MPGTVGQRVFYGRVYYMLVLLFRVGFTVRSCQKMDAWTVSILRRWSLVNLRDLATLPYLRRSSCVARDSLLVFRHRVHHPCARAREGVKA